MSLVETCSVCKRGIARLKKGECAAWSEPDQKNCPYAESAKAPSSLACTDLRGVIENALLEYRCQHTQDDDENGSRLVDVFTPLDRIDISTGKDEVHQLADFLSCEIINAPSATTPAATRSIAGLEVMSKPYEPDNAGDSDRWQDPRDTSGGETDCAPAATGATEFGDRMREKGFAERPLLPSEKFERAPSAIAASEFPPLPVTAPELAEVDGRINAALKRIKDGHAPMRVPVDPTDVDMVLVCCQQVIKRQAEHINALLTPPTSGFNELNLEAINELATQHPNAEGIIENFYWAVKGNWRAIDAILKSHFARSASGMRHPLIEDLQRAANATDFNEEGLRSLCGLAAEAIEALASAATSFASAMPDFDQVLRGIVGRMSGHTISAQDGPAWRTFMCLLAQVKKSECAFDRGNKMSDPKKNPFHVDPWEAAKAHYEHEMHSFMVALLQHFNVTQVELDPTAIILGMDHAIEMRDLPNGKRHYRIIGKLEMLRSPDTTTKGKAE